MRCKRDWKKRSVAIVAHFFFTFRTVGRYFNALCSVLWDFFGGKKWMIALTRGCLCVRAWDTGKNASVKYCTEWICHCLAIFHINTHCVQYNLQWKGNLALIFVLVCLLLDAHSSFSQQHTSSWATKLQNNLDSKDGCGGADTLSIGTTFGTFLLGKTRMPSCFHLLMDACRFDRIAT